MRKYTVYIHELLDFLSPKVKGILGDYDEELYIDNLADSDRVNETSLDWINPSKVNKKEIAEKSRAKVLLVDDSITAIKGKLLIQVKNPKVALADVGNHFFVNNPKPGIHPTAIIDPDAIIGNDVSIGAYCVIGNANIGDGTVLESFVKVYDDTIIGKACTVKSGAILGGPGFGYERDTNGNMFRFPQIGQLIIGDYVEIGANTCIDRGALSDTVIGNYTKINNLCHIAHNSKIGRNVTITGCVNVSGSNIIDDDVWLAPNSSIRGWVHIGSGAVIGMGAVVIKDVPSNETWVGNPAHKLEK